MRLFLMILILLCSGYLVACASLFASQRKLIYYPQPTINTFSYINLAVADANLQISTRPHFGNKALIYFGGNAEDVALNLSSFSTAFPDYALYLMHYRGYGKSTGALSETALQQDALALFDKVHALHSDIALMGRSLGTGIAVYLASQKAISRLILITPYNSLQEVAQFQMPYFPVSWLLLDKYESWRYAPLITAPTLILAADKDEVIPLSNTQLLSSHFKKELVSLQVLSHSNHNNISQNPQYFPLLIQFMNKKCHAC
jgi:pimeloyl-ACP methyl ester carboxylesterase